MRWYKGPHLVRNSKYYKTFVTDNVCTLVIRQALLEDQGEYRCVGKNPFGEASDSAYVRILGKNLQSCNNSSVTIILTRICDRCSIGSSTTCSRKVRRKKYGGCRRRHSLYRTGSGRALAHQYRCIQWRRAQAELLRQEMSTSPFVRLVSQWTADSSR